jgi:hypothetical protein
VKIVPTPFTTNGGVFTTETLSGQVTSQPDVLRLTPSGKIRSKIVTMNLPGSVFDRGGKIQYGGENSDTTKFFEYTVHVFTYNSIIKTDSGSRSGV